MAKAQQRASDRKALRAGLDTQVQYRAEVLATEAELEREDFEMNAKALEDVVLAEKAEEAEAIERRLQNKQGVILQIQQKEREAIQARKDFFDSGSHLSKEAADRKRRLDEIKQRKLAALEDELRYNGVDNVDAKLHEVHRAAEADLRRSTKVTR